MPAELSSDTVFPPQTSVVSVGCTGSSGIAVFEELLFIIDAISGKIIFGITYGLGVGVGVETRFDELLVLLLEVVVLPDELVELEALFEELELLELLELEFLLEELLVPEDEFKFGSPLLDEADGVVVALGDTDLLPLGDAVFLGDVVLLGDEADFDLPSTYSSSPLALGLAVALALAIAASFEKS